MDSIFAAAARDAATDFAHQSTAGEALPSAFSKGVAVPSLVGVAAETLFSAEETGLITRFGARDIRGDPLRVRSCASKISFTFCDIACPSGEGVQERSEGVACTCRAGVDVEEATGADREVATGVVTEAETGEEG